MQNFIKAKCYNKAEKCGGFMSVYTIQNELVSVKIDEHAAEIHSFYDKESGIESMWQGDAKYWAGRNPTLFPMVGKTWDGVLHIQGKEYQMGNHGFCRHSDFQCIHHSESEVVMELCDSDETLAQYPFQFRLEVKFSLHGKKLDISYTVENRSDVVMPFNFGLHPAFNCPSEDSSSFADYYLELNAKEDVDDKQMDHFQLDTEKLAKTIIINQPKSTCAKITNGKHGVMVEYKGFPWLAFWSPNAPFVCIEPWYSHTDFEKVDVPFEKREGTIMLEVNKSWETAYSITVF